MGKHLLSSMNSTVQFHDNHHHPGCMWGILHILDYHHWHNIRNVFPLKKHYSGRHARYKRKNLLHRVEEAEPLLVRQHGKKWSSTGKNSPKISNEGSHTKNRSNYSKHSESSHKFVKFKECDIMDYSGKKLATSEQKLIEAKKLNRDTPIKSKRHGDDVLEVLGVEKDLLIKFLLDIDVCEENLQLDFNNKARLTKSVSVPQPSQMRSISPVFLEHKQKEIWPFHKGGKLIDGGAQAQKMLASSFGNISYVKPMALLERRDFGLCRAMKLKHKQSFSSASNPQGLNHMGWNQLVLHRFKIMKKKIKHAIVEFRKSGYQTSVEAIHHRASSTKQSLDGAVIREYTDNRSSDETKTSDYDSSIHEARRMKRASSLNESLDRYTQLFEQSFNKDIKWHSSKSKSLKLPNEEDKNNKNGFRPKASRRNLSVPNLDSFGLFILHEALSDANDETDIHFQRKSVSFPLHKDNSLDHISESEEMEETVDSSVNDEMITLLPDETLEKIDEGMNCDHREDTNELGSEDGSFLQEQVEIGMATYPSNEALETIETSFETSHGEGRESNARGSNMDELESELPNREIACSWPGSLHNTDATEKGTQIKPDTDTDDSNFKYVKDVLESLDFKGKEDIQMWHTLNFDGSWSHEIEFSGEEEEEEEEETLNTNHHHLILSNLVKEVLLQIHEISPSYFPRNFSFNRCIDPMHNKGHHHLVNEVWTRVNSYMNLRPELDQTLDDVVGRDLAKNSSSGWMNLQNEEECVALALEEMIVKDLLDEVIFT